MGFCSYQSPEVRRAEASPTSENRRQRTDRHSPGRRRIGVLGMGYRPDSFRLSARSLAMFGFTSDDEKIGATHAAWQARIHPEDLPVILAKVRAYQKNPSERLECEYRVRHRSGVSIWVLDRGRWLGDAGRQLIVGTLLDISSRKEMEQQLLHMAITDPLTDLSNRRAFNERLQLEWERLKRSPEIQAALVLCDIDHFKRINDTYSQTV